MMPSPRHRVYGYLITFTLVGIALVFLSHTWVNVEMTPRRWDTRNTVTLPSSESSPTATLRNTQATAIQTSGTTYTDTNNVTSSEQPHRAAGPVPVIILTYMRSGSSFTGQILQAAPSTFYWFEPFHKLLFNFTPGYQFRFLNGSSRAFSAPEYVASLTASDIASCHLNRLPVKVLTDGFLGHGNVETSHNFISCLSAYRKLKSDPIMALRRCIPDYEETCLQSEHVVIKTIRMSMARIENLLVKYPRLKVVHLMRDPRATMKSQKRYGGFRKNRNVTENIRTFCRNVLRDVLDREGLQRQFPDRIIPVFYEDIAKNPIDNSKRLYQFLGMEFTNEAEEKILNMTSSGIEEKKCGSLCTNRSNSSAESYEWRHQISFDFVQMVDKACVDLYNKIGYKTVPNKTLLLDVNYRLRY